jgi:hypothetical protein
MQREAEIQYELKQMQDINNSQEVNQTYFWYLVNKRKKRGQSTHPIKLENGMVLTDQDDIRNAWKLYFQKLYTPSKNPEYNEQFRQQIVQEVKQMEHESFYADDNVIKDGITLGEVTAIINKLKNKKAPGIDNISAEHIKCGGVALHKCIVLLFNVITKYEYVPICFKKGIVVPIPKGSKNKESQDNYRGLTLLPVLSKMYETYVTKQIEKWLKDRNIISNFQGAAQEKCSNVHTAWLVKETIHANLDKGKSVYVGILDTKKAYDTVWQDGLFHKIYTLGICGKAWRILRCFYENFSCQVRLGSELSEPFTPLQGIHQGAPCSMLMFEVYDNELLIELQTCVPAIKVCKTTVNGAAYADDITLIAVSKASLQTLFDIAYRYSKKWQFQYNPNKCAVLIYGKDGTKDQEVYIGQHKLHVSNKEPHLGLVLATEDKYEVEYIKGRIAECKAICYGIQSIGLYRVPISPVVANKLYKDVCMPKLCYGAELMEISKHSLCEMETFHCQSAKLIQGLPTQSSNSGSIFTMGWHSIEATVDIMRLMFLWRVLSMSMSNIYKVIMLRRIFEILSVNSGSGPVWNMMETCKRYSLLSEVIEAAECGSYMSIAAWKNLVNNIVRDKDFRRCKITCTLYKSLQMLNNNTPECNMWSWWQLSYRCPSMTKACRLIVRLLLNVYQLGKKKCHLCCMYKTNCIEHILFECTISDDIRCAMWNNVVETCPQQLVYEMNSMSLRNRSFFILNAFMSKFVMEWTEIYMSVGTFVHDVYNHYYNQMNILDTE